MSPTFYFLLLNLLICSACSKHHHLLSNGYDEYKLVSLTLKVENVNRRLRINSFICDGDEAKLKVVSSLKKVAHEISKVLFNENILQEITANKKIEHGSYILGTQEITYSKKSFNEAHTAWVCGHNFVNKNYGNLCFKRRIAFNNCIREVGYSHTCDQDGKCVLVRIYGETNFEYPNFVDGTEYTTRPNIGMSFGMTTTRRQSIGFHFGQTTNKPITNEIFQLQKETSTLIMPIKVDTKARNNFVQNVSKMSDIIFRNFSY